jgi:hypothetical protein
LTQYSEGIRKDMVLPKSGKYIVELNYKKRKSSVEGREPAPPPFPYDNSVKIFLDEKTESHVLKV